MIKEGDKKSGIPVDVDSIRQRGFFHSDYKYAYVDSEFTTDGTIGKDPFSRAINMLHISVLPDQLPCRGTERTQIERAIRESIEHRGAVPPIYISGMPGKGSFFGG
jgi:hypothetical protein